VGLEAQRHLVRSIVDDPSLTYRQRVHALAGAAENLLDPPVVSDACAAALDKHVICDLFEGNAPYRPRYTLPDYDRAMAQGSRFLELSAPADFDDATAFLLSVYGNVPSITGYPVWFGEVDRLLEPFAADLDDTELFARLRRFWVLLDRLFPDGFAHANLGPADGRVTRAALAVHRDVHQVVPNLTLKVDPAVTPDDLLLDAMRTVVEVAQPHLVNHPMMVADLGERYGVVSCYNSLPVGGGSHTLVRLNLQEVAHRHAGASPDVHDPHPAPLRRAHRRADGGPHPSPGRAGPLLRPLVAGTGGVAVARSLHRHVRPHRARRVRRAPADPRRHRGPLRPRRPRRRSSPTSRCGGSRARR
jgi:YjjI family glycine radical enzyme